MLVASSETQRAQRKTSASQRRGWHRGKLVRSEQRPYRGCRAKVVRDDAQRLLPKLMGCQHNLFVARVLGW